MSDAPPSRGPHVAPSPFSGLVLDVDRLGRVRSAEGSGRIGDPAPLVGREAGALFARGEIAEVEALLSGDRGSDHAPS